MTRDEKQKEILRLSIEASRRGYLFVMPAVVGYDEDEWIRDATAALERIDRPPTGASNE